MKYYAVIDTNVIVSALLSKREDSPTVNVLKEMLGGRIIPLYHEEILEEYKEVLRRRKFHLTTEVIDNILEAVKEFGLEVFPTPTGEILVDMDDLIFYEVTMEKLDKGAFLVTGNKKHYPIRNFILTPAEMMDMLEKDQIVDKR